MSEHESTTPNEHPDADFAESTGTVAEDIEQQAPRTRWDRLRASLVTISAVLATTALGIGPLMVGTALLGRHVGTPIGATAAAAIMWLVLSAVLRDPDRPSAAFAGMVAFAIGILMAALAVMDSAGQFIPSGPIAAVVGVLGAIGVTAGFVVWAKRRYDLWKNAQGYQGGLPAPPPL